MQLVGQTVDTQKLRDIRKLLGHHRRPYRHRGRFPRGPRWIAAKIDEKGAEGTAFLRVAQRQPRQFRFFYSRLISFRRPGPTTAVHWRPAPGSSPALSRPKRAADIDGLLAELVERDAAPAPVPEAASVKIIDAVIGSPQATGPPRHASAWLPPLGAPPAADDLVARLRGKPWDVDYGQNPGLVLPVALEDRPRQHRQDVCYLNMLESSAPSSAPPYGSVPTRS